MPVTVKFGQTFPFHWFSFGCLLHLSCRLSLKASKWWWNAHEITKFETTQTALIFEVLKILILFTTELHLVCIADVLSVYLRCRKKWRQAKNIAWTFVSKPVTGNVNSNVFIISIDFTCFFTTMRCDGCNSCYLMNVIVIGSVSLFLSLRRHWYCMFHWRK